MTTLTNNHAPIKAFLETYQKRIEEQLNRFLPNAEQSPTRLHQAMRYAVMGGGKRIRPLLTYAVGISFNGSATQLDAPAVAVEFIHAYSLIHDDLPSMDNDDFRRGKLSCHKAFDEATAILAGDALQSLAFEVLADQDPRLVGTLARASGSLGMAGGQQLDLESQGRRLSREEVLTIHRLKTGALFQAAMCMGAIAAGCKNEREMAWLKELSNHVGVLFQLQDDWDDKAYGNDQQQADVLRRQIDEYTAQINHLLHASKRDTQLIELILARIFHIRQ